MANKWSVKRTVDPLVEPVTVGQVKDHLRVSTSVDDTVIGNIISAARQQVERDTGKSLITQTWQLTLDDFPGVGEPIKYFNGPFQIEPIKLWNGPVQSVSSFTYNNSSGSQVAWADYQLKTNDNPALIVPNFQGSYPTDYSYDKRGIVITYVAGYGDSHVDVPLELRQAVILRAEMIYDGESKNLVSAYERLTYSQRLGLY